ncbi:MAG: Succinate dehydrogenase flavoprotein subunit [Alphaproteobacteria bacterium MarineAlpha11_Bin1]|nr:MAG: Succinate dehydrogenase flavoprotein subunit [Alphaproteobacteria bacterium MarineAlpha11_Bin1]|tara:strand:+ start:2624 stop:4585 length:1962 start_codon:yes stop_codon:yes gene_type:complete
MPIEVDWCKYDVVVVGSGGAGSHAAQAAAANGARVLVVSKDPIGCSDTKISEGIATVRESGSDDDSEETLSENLKIAGGDLPVNAITNAFAADSKGAYDTYRVQGLRPDINTSRNTPKPLPLPMGGHTRRRSVGHRNSGIAFGHANWNAVVQGDRIDYIEDSWFLDLVTDDGEGGAPRSVVGGIIYHAALGKLIAVKTSSVIIASGGLSTLYFPKTDTMRGNTGDSYAIAVRAGADLVDMEQVQFLPFCLASPPSFEGLLVGEPVTASYLGVLRDKYGKVILDSVFLRTRAECSSAIMRAVEDGRGSPNGGAYLDMTANKRPPRSGPYFMRFVESALPSAYKVARQAMSKAAGNCEVPWEVRPSAHYMMGGIRANEHGASVSGAGDGFADSGVAGLFTAGQAMGGVFGANRLGSTSLTEGAVFGRRAGEAAANRARKTASLQSQNDAFSSLIESFRKRFGQKGGCAAATLKLELQRAAWINIGPIRTADRINEMERVLSDLEVKLEDVAIPEYTEWNQAFIEFEELRNLIFCARGISLAARERDGSLGGHVRLDRKQISSFSHPYSTVVSKNPEGSWQVRRVDRDRTPLRQIIAFKYHDAKRKAGVKWLRILPAGMQDRALEKKYLAVMGADGATKEVMPGGRAAAVGEGTEA